MNFLHQYNCSEFFAGIFAPDVTYVSHTAQHPTTVLNDS